MAPKRKTRKKKEVSAPILPADIRFTSAQKRKINKFVFPLIGFAFMCASFHLSKVYHSLDRTIQPSTAIVIASGAHFYPLPSTLSEEKRIYAPQGTEVSIINQTYAWYQVQTEGGKFWIEQKNLMLAK